MALDEPVITDSLPDAAPGDEPATGRSVDAPAVPGSGRGLLLALAVVVLPTLLGGALAIAKEPWLPVSDNGLIAMTVQDLRGGHLPLTGVYSRFGFHHPGPALFFWLAPFQAVFGPRGLLVGALAMSLLSLGLMVWLLWRRGGDALAVAGAVVLLVLVRAIGVDVAGPWNPWMTTLPMGVVVVSAWAAWRRDWVALPIAVVAGSWCVQVHVGSAIPVAAMGGVVLVGVVLGWRADARPGWRPLVAALIGLGVMWALPAADVARNDPNNVRLLVDAFRQPAEEPVGVSRGVEVAARELGVSLRWVTGDASVEPFTGQVVGAPLLAVLPLAAALLLAFVLAVRRRDADAASFVAVTAVAAGAGAFAITRVTGPALPYLFRWMWTIAALAWLAAGWALVRALVALLPQDRRRTARTIVAVSAVAVVAVLAPWTAAVIRSGDRQDESVSRAVRDLGPQLAPLVDDGGPVLVLPDGEGWQVNTVGLLTELRRRGIDARARNDDYAVAQWAIGSDTPAHTVLVSVFQPRLDRRAAGQTPVASWEPLTVTEQQELQGLSIKSIAFWTAMSRGEPADPLTDAEAARLQELQAKGDPVDVYVDVP